MSPRRRLYRNALLVWLVLFGLAFANGTLRELVLAPRLGAPALPLSGLTAIMAFGVTIGLFVRRARPSWRDAAAIGAVWLMLTLGVEVLLTIAAGKPAADVAVSFTWQALAGGNLFAVMVAVVAVAPALFASAIERPLLRRRCGREPDQQGEPERRRGAAVAPVEGDLPDRL